MKSSKRILQGVPHPHHPNQSNTGRQHISGSSSEFKLRRWAPRYASPPVLLLIPDDEDAEGPPGESFEDFIDRMSRENAARERAGSNQ